MSLSVENWTPILRSLNMLQEGTMGQVHKRFSDEQVAFPLQAYSQGLMTRVEVQEVLGIGKTRFFSLWREYHCNPEAFTVRYRRPSSMRISPEAEAAIDESSARRMLLEVYHDLGGNVSQTARELCCSRNTVRKWVRRHRDSLGLQGRSRRPQNCPRQTAADVESLVVRERKKTNFGRVRLAHHLQWQHGLALSSHTVRNILRRHDLSQPQKKRGKFRAIRTHDWQSLYPLQHFQIELKHILDLNAELVRRLLGELGLGPPAG
ncbi:MAG: hypothetical protein CEE40_05550 [Chloroflexi bacterium B3_Chlor]|nr:MAG: hypothetical protein CEE40_05550 [Chloroflexi bacterium B3_Chlor]